MVDSVTGKVIFAFAFVDFCAPSYFFLIQSGARFKIFPAFATHCKVLYRSFYFGFGFTPAITSKVQLILIALSKLDLLMTLYM